MGLSTKEVLKIKKRMEVANINGVTRQSTMGIGLTINLMDMGLISGMMEENTKGSGKMASWKDTVYICI